MTESKFQPGTLVRDNNSRVGKVVGGIETRTVGGESVNVLPVDFWGELQNRPAEFLTPLDNDSPEALLLERPGALASWVEDAPLRLVALALSAGGGIGKVADIREKLEGRVIEEGRWRNWWNKRTKALGSLSEHFGVVKGGKGNDYKLLSCAEDVPADWKPPAKPKPATRADWERWIAADSEEPPPGRFPPKQVCDSLAKWSGRDIDWVLARMANGAGHFLVSERKPPKQAAAAWLEAVSQAAANRRQAGGIEHLDGEIGELLQTLARLAGRDKVLRVLADAFVAPDDFALKLEELQRSLASANTRHAREMEEVQRKHDAELIGIGQSHDAKVETLRQSHETELKLEEHERERLQDRVETLRNQLFKGYEHSKLDIRQDMLVIVGELSQLAANQDCATENFLRDVRAGLSLALQAGDAKFVGAAGDAVAFDPTEHQAKESVRIGDTVRIIAPAVVVKGQHTDDRVLVKAQVSGFSEKG